MNVTIAASARWPAGSGEMVGLVRTHDWSASALGPVSRWSQSLRSAVDMVLPMGFPAIVLWGADLVQIYNDRYRDIMGVKHPTGLGQATRECWPEVWSINAPIYSRVWSGETVTFEEARYPLAVSGAVEDRWLTLTYSPLRDESGTVAGILVMLIDVTARRAAEHKRLDMEAQLRRSEQRYRTFVTTSSDIVFRMDPDWKTLREIAGRDLPTGTVEAAANWFETYVHPEDRAKVAAEIEKATTAKGMYELEHRFQKVDGTNGWVLVRAVPTLDDDGEIIEWIGAAADVTIRHETEEQLRQSEERFRALVEGFTQTTWEATAEGIIAADSPSWRSYTGQTLKQWLGEGWLDAVHPSDRAYAQRAGREAVETGRNLDVEFRLRHAPSGAWRWTNIRAVPLRAADGSVIKWLGASVDVHDRKTTEEHLRSNRRRLWALIQGIPQLVWRAGENGAWTWSSPQWSTYTGQSEDESLGFGWLAALHPDDREHARASWEDADGSRYLDMETRVLGRKELRYRWFQSRALPVKDESGNTIEWLGTSTDIDDLRQLQERQEVLVAELQHRTRNLLSVVQSMADRTAAGANSLQDFLPQYRERLRALSRINSLLSKLEQGQRVTFDEMIRAELGARGVFGGHDDRVVLDGPTGVRLRSATVQTFALAIHELATNAVKYGALSNGSGSLSVRWWLHREGADPNRLHVEWLEQGVHDMPRPGDGPKGGGYGRELIEKALPYQLKARTAYELRADGVRCTIDLPLN